MGESRNFGEFEWDSVSEKSNQTKIETKLSENELLDLKMFHSPVKMTYDF